LNVDEYGDRFKDHVVDPYTSNHFVAKITAANFKH